MVIDFTATKKRTANVPSLQQIIADTFKNSVKEFRQLKRELEVGEFVLARMRGYCPWPAKIVSFTKDRRSTKCYFYGSHNNGSVNISEIIPFKDGYNTIRLIKIRCLKDFEKGIREIEIENGIPDHLSSLREVETICQNV